MQRILPIVAIALLPQSSLLALTPYSAGTVGTLNSTTGSQLLYRSDISNPSQTLVLTPAVIGDGAVGRNGVTTAAARLFWQVSAYRVSDLLAAIGSNNLADLANYTFTYTGVTEASTTLIPVANEYRAAYLGQWEDTGAATTDVPVRPAAAQNMTDTGDGSADAARTLFGTAIETISGYANATAQASQQVVDLNVTDLASTAQTLTAKGFNLSHLATDLAADTDLSNNYIFFTFYLDPKLLPGGALTQCFTGVKLIPVENVDPKTIVSGTHDVAGPLNTDDWGFKNLNHSGGTIRFELDPSGPDQLFVEGNYTHTGGDISIQLYSPPATGTAIPLLYYGGTMTGTPAVSLVNDSRFSLSASALGDGSNDAVTATFSGAKADLVWTGSQGAAWDLKTTQNWKVGVTPETFYNVDKVTFDDLGTNFTPAIAGTLYPSAVVFTNTGVNDYTLGGAGSISGAATLSHTGDAKVTLLGNHDYTGATSVTNLTGILQVGNGGTSGSIGSGPLSLTGEFIFDRSDSVVFANATTGTNGLFTKKGAGTLTLAANHTGSLGYTVEGGTLRVGQGGATGSLATSSNATVAAGSTLEFFRNGNAVTIGTSLSGDGVVAFKGTGVASQSAYSLNGGSGSFAGTAIADAARVQIDQVLSDLGAATAVKALTGGQIYLSAAGDFAYPLELRGDGWLETAGQLGALRLAAAANVTGPITLAGNTRIGCIGSTGTLSGNISESGGARALELFGNSTLADAGLTLSGTNSHSGGTTVRGLIATVQSVTGFGSGPVAVEAHPVNPARLSGVLFSAVTIANPITVAANSVVFGTGGTTGTVTLNGGTFAPGNSFPGTLAAGNLVAQTGSILDIRISSSAQSTDLATVGGTVTLGSGVQLLVHDVASTPVALANGTKLAILDYTGGSLTGTFSGIVDGGTLVVGPNTFIVDYNDNSNGVAAGLFVTLTVSTISPFDAWEDAAGLDGTPGKDDGFDRDPDGDGVANGLEWILGGNPLVSAGGLVTTSTSPAGLTLTFTRKEESIGQATLTLEWNAGLQGAWTSVPIGAASANAANGVTITVTAGPSPDQVSVFIPDSNAVGGKLFARLKATQP